MLLLMATASAPRELSGVGAAGRMVWRLEAAPCGAARPEVFTEWLGNSICDAECFGPMCDYDGGDCNPTTHCRAARHLLQFFAGAQRVRTDERSARLSMGSIGSCCAAKAATCRLTWDGVATSFPASPVGKPAGAGGNRGDVVLLSGGVCTARSPCIGTPRVMLPTTASPSPTFLRHPGTPVPVDNNPDLWGGDGGAGNKAVDKPPVFRKKLIRLGTRL